MFDALTKRLSTAFRTITGKGKLSEENIQEGLREVRLALLEADVNLSVVKSFIQRVKEQAIGMEVTKGLSPAQQFIKIVQEELTTLLGGEHTELHLTDIPSTIMVVGLQGSGKTTSLAKIAKYLQSQKKKPYLVPVDIYRPAAIQQLQTLANQLNIPVFPTTVDMKPTDIVTNARKEAMAVGADVILLDTAGRLQIDATLMQELVDIKKNVSPNEILFVADAMLGQEAANVAEEFHKQLGITGIVFTKTDGDARGGAILSIKSVTGVGIKFVGTGEKITDIEPFHPDRMANRILGMGDVLTLIERAQEHIEQEEMEALEKKLKKATFTLNDFLAQMKKLKSLGSIESILKLIPGGSGLLEQMGKNTLPEKELQKTESIIQSMTKQERENTDILNASRKQRIAKGSGTQVQDVNALIKNFENMKGMMKKIMGGNSSGSGGTMDAMKNMMGKLGMGNSPGGMPSLFGGDQYERPTISKTAQKKKKEQRKKEKAKKKRK